VLSAIACFGSSMAIAGSWRLGSNLTLAEQYTDSVDASSVSGKQRALVTEIRPAFTLERRGARAGVHADYQVQEFLYATQSIVPTEFRTWHQLQAKADAELVRQHLFVEALGGVSQSVIDPSQRFALDNATLSGNRSNVLTYGARSRWQNRLGDYASGQAVYDYTVTDQRTALAADTVAQNFSGTASTGSAFRRFTGAAQVRAQRSENSIGASAIGTANGSLQVGYWLSPEQWRAYGRLIYLRNPQLNVQTQSQNTGLGRIVGLDWTPGTRLALGANYGVLPTGDTYEFTTRWRPSTLTSVSAMAGRATFGRTYSASLASRGRHGGWTLSYQEDLTTQSLALAEQAWLVVGTTAGGQEFRQIATGNQNQVNTLQDSVGRGGGTLSATQLTPTSINIPFVRARATAATDISGSRNKVRFSIYRESHQYQELLANDRILGASLGWDMTLSSRSNLNATANLQDANYGGSARQNNSMQGSLAYLRQFGPSTSGSLSYTYTNRVTTGVADQDQTIVRAQLVMKF